MYVCMKSIFSTLSQSFKTGDLRKVFSNLKPVNHVNINLCIYNI